MKKQILLISILSLLIFSTNSYARIPEVDIQDLDGAWNVTSNNWGGDPMDFEGSVVRVKLAPDSVQKNQDLTSFVAHVSFIGGLLVVDHDFCAIRYERLENSFKLFRNYFRPVFWMRDDYLCFNEAAVTDGMGHDKMLVRFILESPTTARALVYYDLVAVDTTTTSEQAPVPAPPGAPEETSPSASTYTVGAGIFELELEKQ